MGKINFDVYLKGKQKIFLLCQNSSFWAKMVFGNSPMKPPSRTFFWGRSSIGRASHLQCEGKGSNPRLHQKVRDGGDRPACSGADIYIEATAAGVRTGMVHHSIRSWPSANNSISSVPNEIEGQQYLVCH